MSGIYQPAPASGSGAERSISFCTSRIFDKVGSSEVMKTLQNRVLLHYFCAILRRGPSSHA